MYDVFVLSSCAHDFNEGRLRVFFFMIFILQLFHSVKGYSAFHGFKDQRMTCSVTDPDPGLQDPDPDPSISKQNY